MTAMLYRWMTQTKFKLVFSPLIFIPSTTMMMMMIRMIMMIIITEKGIHRLPKGQKMVFRAAP